MKLGTHNSMTYLKPKKWYMYPFRFMARCQDIDIERQYEYGVRHFDLRIVFDKDGTPEFRHGMMAYKGDVYKTISYLNERPEPVYCKFWLELNKDNEEQEKLFAYLCELLEKGNKNIKFYGGQNKKGKALYRFKNGEPVHVACFSSLQKPVFDDLYPKLYAKRHNKNAKKNCRKGLLILDFVEIG